MRYGVGLGVPFGLSLFRIWARSGVWCGGWGTHSYGVSKVYELVWGLNQVGQLDVGYRMVGLDLATGWTWLRSWTRSGSGVKPRILRTLLSAWCGDWGHACLWVQQGVGAGIGLDGVGSWM